MALGQHQGRTDIHMEHIIELQQDIGVNRTAGKNPGIIDKAVNFSERVVGRFNDMRDGAVIGEVGRHPMGALAKLCCILRQHVRPCSVQHHRRARIIGGLCNGKSNAGR